MKKIGIRAGAGEAGGWQPGQLAEVAGQVNLSVSQLERSFTRHVGVGPKLLARQTRLSALAAEAMTCASPCWAFLAAQYGYADQAHMAGEFRGLKGLTPSSLARAGTDADFLQDARPALWESLSLRLQITWQLTEAGLSKISPSRVSTLSGEPRR